MQFRRLSLAVCTIALATSAFAEDELPESRPGDWTCFVTVKNNIIGLPEEPEDGLFLFQVFVATSSSCQAGVVYVAAYPESDCFVRPKRDPNHEERMVFTYKPRVLTIAVEPGNQASGTIEIESPSHGACSFNSQVASCGTVIPQGGKCEVRKLDDPRAENSGAVGTTFNRIR
jgi:hypothetical protein